MSQCNDIITHIKRSCITQLDAQRLYGVSRLAARIDDLKRLGHPVQSRTIEVKNRDGETCRVKEYWLSKKYVNNFDKIEVYKKIMRGYPDNHNQINKIQQQIDRLL